MPSILRTTGVGGGKIYPVANICLYSVLSKFVDIGCPKAFTTKSSHYHYSCYSYTSETAAQSND
jgi:hypothetical protein